MSKKREGIVNAQPFITNDASVGTSRKQSNVQKNNQQQDKVTTVNFILKLFQNVVITPFPFLVQFLEAGISCKIMKVALAQEKQIVDEENAERNPITIVFSAASTLNAEEEKRVIEAEEDDIDDFDGKFDDDSYQVSVFTLPTYFFNIFISVLKHYKRSLFHARLDEHVQIIQTSLALLFMLIFYLFSNKIR